MLQREAQHSDSTHTRSLCTGIVSHDAFCLIFVALRQLVSTIPQKLSLSLISIAGLPLDTLDVIEAENKHNFEVCKSPVKKKLKFNSPVAAQQRAAAVVASSSCTSHAPVPVARHGLSNNDLDRVRGLKKTELIAELRAMGGDFIKCWTKPHLLDALLEAYAAHNFPPEETQLHNEQLLDTKIEMMEIVSESEADEETKQNEAQPSTSSKGSSKQTAAYVFESVSRSEPNISTSKDGLSGKDQSLHQQGMVKRAIAAKEKQVASKGVARGTTATAEPKVVDDDNDCMSITSLSAADKPEASYVVVKPAKAENDKQVAKGVDRGTAAAEPKRIDDDKRISAISLGATDKLEALSIVDDATEPNVAENDRESAMEIDEPVAAKTTGAVGAPDDEYDESEDFQSAQQTESQSYPEKPVVLRHHVPNLSPIKGSESKPPRSSPSAVPRGTVHSITKKFLFSQTKQPPLPVTFPSLHGRDGNGNERELGSAKPLANNRLLSTPAFSGILSSGAKPGTSNALKPKDDARMVRAAEIKALVRLMEQSSMKPHFVPVAHDPHFFFVSTEQECVQYFWEDHRAGERFEDNQTYGPCFRH